MTARRHFPSAFSFVTLSIGGRLVWKSVASWYAFASVRRSVSPYSRPVNVTACGKSPAFRSVNPHGRQTVGWPVWLVIC